MKRALVVATVFKFLNFEKSDIEILQSMGYEVHTATNMHEADWLQDDGSFDGVDIKRHQLDFGRSPFSMGNIKAFRQLKSLIDKGNFDIIHCHTPVAAAITRIVAIKARKRGAYVIYTCHGFHFHKKSSKKSWILYYPIEKLLAPITDMIITINKEDFSVLKKFRVKERRYIPGVGVDVEHIRALKSDRKKMLSELGIPEEAFVILSIGELSARKNQSVMIDAISKLNDKNIYYVLCGTGEKQDEFKRLAKIRGVAERVIFTGQKDHEWVMQFCHAIDIGAIPSAIEGLGLAGIEILAAGKPLVGSNVHGINDYIMNGVDGFSCDPFDSDGFAAVIKMLMDDNDLYLKCAVNAAETARRFDISRVKKLMMQNYKDIWRKAENEIHIERCQRINAKDEG